MDLSSRIVRAQDALSAPVDNEIVLLAPALDEYVALNDIGRQIWDALEETQSVEQLCRRLSSEFDASTGEIAADIMPFLDELAGKGLVHVVEE